MCRLVVYRGHNKPLLLASLLTRPTHSIIKQSLDSKERLLSPVNGDGFGVGWYEEGSCACDVEVSTPCVFLATSPAWNNSNLHRLADHVVSNLIFAHVRAASPGLTTNESNCHPFSYGPFLWMHNGDIPSFTKFKRQALLSLPSHLFDHIQGHTDSELCFMLFLHQLGVGPLNGQPNTCNCSTCIANTAACNTCITPIAPSHLLRAMRCTLQHIRHLCHDVGGDDRCVLNFVTTDGASVVATRYAKQSQPASLYYASGSGWEQERDNDNDNDNNNNNNNNNNNGNNTHNTHNDATYVMQHTERVPRAHIVASEPLSDPKDWVKIPPQSILIITPESELFIHPADEEQNETGKA